MQFLDQAEISQVCNFHSLNVPVRAMLCKTVLICKEINKEYCLQRLAKHTHLHDVSAIHTTQIPFACYIVTILSAAHNTSSTARGGGGSFENRKRIEEIGCCESRMTKQKH